MRLILLDELDESSRTAHNKSLHWIFTPLRCVKTSEFKRYTDKTRNEMMLSGIAMKVA